MTRIVLGTSYIRIYLSWITFFVHLDWSCAPPMSPTMTTECVYGGWLVQTQYWVDNTPTRKRSLDRNSSFLMEFLNTGGRWGLERWVSSSLLTDWIITFSVGVTRYLLFHVKYEVSTGPLPRLRSEVDSGVGTNRKRDEESRWGSYLVNVSLGVESQTKIP